MYNRRKRNHNYYKPFTYHIILKKLKGVQDFGKIVGYATIPPGLPGSARVDYTKIGFAIFNALKEFEEKYKEFIKKQYSIMPDHVHIILQKTIETNIHLENYILKLKWMVVENCRKEGLQFNDPDEIFEERMTDKLLYRNISVKTWIEYVAQNPHRRAMVMQRPLFFQSVRNLIIDAKRYEAYGNLFLFRNPDKFAVRMRRRFSVQQITDHKNLALLKVKEATVLVSPFISEEEKLVREEALAEGGKIIMIVHEEFGDKYKPAKRNFELCCEGRLLLISLGYPKGTPLSYEIATQGNELAEKIVKMSLV